MLQVLSKEEYACWLRCHLEAETAIQGREELLFESALRLETDLHLLGQKPSLVINKCVNNLFAGLDSVIGGLMLQLIKLYGK